MRSLLFSLVCALVCVSGFTLLKNQTTSSAPDTKIFPAPTDPTIINHRGEQEQLEHQREVWFENMHRAAPGVNWRAIETQNMLDAYQRSSSGNILKTDGYANGILQGNWSERGSKNLAGRVELTDYDYKSNKLIAVNDAGAMYRGVPDSAGWHVVNDQLRFGSKGLKIIPNGSNHRIIGVVGLNTYYSDNDGTTFTASTGFSFPVDWGGNYIGQIVSLSDAGNTLYCLTYEWDPTPWDARTWLWRSTDRGASWSKIFTFPVNFDQEVVMWVPYGQKKYLYALNNENTVPNTILYKIQGTTVTIKNTSNSGNFPTNTPIQFKGITEGANTKLYALIPGDGDLFTSRNLGKKWTFVSNTPGWCNQLAVSNVDSNKVSAGTVNAYRSTDGGVTWTQVNDWTEYYADVTHKLHADMRCMNYYKRKNGTEFGIIGCDGGAYRTDDYLNTVSNISLQGLNIGEFYDVLSDPTDSGWAFGGSQDQGFQRTSNLSTAGQIDFTQVISGDYGHLQLTRSNQTLWMVYPNGSIYYYYTSHNGLSNLDYTVPGTFKPIWIPPTAPVYPASTNKIFIGGGNTSGGDGSFLIKLTGGSLNPFAITAAQFSYDFKANSSDGNSSISAIGTTSLDANRIYVGTQDGAFFYSANGGTSWSKTSSFSGPTPWYLYGSAIYASKLTANLVYYGGSGYSNPPVYKSTDGGVTFTSCSNGLPSTLVYDLVGNPDETLLFAATDAGPYVYVVADNLWYPFSGGFAPLSVSYTAVDYDFLPNKVRYASYGRGIWDFKITAQPRFATSALPSTIFSASVIPNLISKGAPVQINSSATGEMNFMLFDYSGKMVMTKSVSAAEEIETTDVAAGVYIYVIEQNGNKRSGKLVIQ